MIYRQAIDSNSATTHADNNNNLVDDVDDEDNGIVRLIVSTLLICFSFSKYHLTCICDYKIKFGARLCEFLCISSIYLYIYMHPQTHTHVYIFIQIRTFVFSPHICVINKRVMYMRAYTDFQTYYITSTKIIYTNK